MRTGRSLALAGLVAAIVGAGMTAAPTEAAATGGQEPTAEAGAEAAATKGSEALAEARVACHERGGDPAKATVASIRTLGTALYSWMIDRLGAPQPEDAKLEEQALGVWESLEPEPEGVSTWLRYPHETLTPERLEALLKPSPELYYVAEIPLLDGWCRPLEVVGSPDAPFAPTVFAIRSAGANGEYEGPRYEAGDFPADAPADDIVWIDGSFVRMPKTPAK